MDSSDYIYMMIWINVRLCLPFTLIVFALGCVVRLDGFPVTFYMNLLVSNLIQLAGLVALMVKINENNFHPICFVALGCGALASICFRTVFALERYFLISWPELHFIRQTKGYVIFCVLIWLFAIFLFPLFMTFSQYIFFVLFPLIPTPVFIFCVARTPKFLPAATSLTTGEKRRIVAALMLLLIVHICMILPLSLSYINSYFGGSYVKYNSSLILFLFSPFMDLILFVFMCEGLVDKLLMCFSCHSCSR
uniref:G-protein coupled receptors family 1 profile domain-containing protein n=1 Tax=Poecilia mexicana TaxID=48701 RepID=A0A3B3Z562_9TELE